MLQIRAPWGHKPCWTTGPLTAPAKAESRAFTAEFIDLHTGLPPALHLSGYPEQTFQALAIDATVAREYGRLAAAVVAAGRKPRTRSLDLLIAATASANDARLYTRNPSNLVGLEDLLEIVTIR